MIELQNVQKTYITKNKSETKALKNINVKLPNSGLCFLLGKSGCGKSTLLNIIGGIEKATSGDVIIEGKNLSLYSEKEMDAYRANYIGFVFQEFNLIENLNVKDNLLISAELASIKINEQDIKKALDEIDLPGIENRYPKELSAGQQQRVAIARAIIKQPKVILADEPTGNLDSINAAEIFKVLKTLSKTQLIFVVTHDKQLASEFGDTIIEMKDGEIISINEKEKVNLSYNTLNTKTIQKKSLSLKRIFGMAFSGLRKKIALLTLAILICTAAISCFAFGQAVLKFDYNHYLIKTLENNDISLFSLNKRSDANDIESKYFTMDESNEAKNLSPNNLFYNRFDLGYYDAYVIKDESDLIKMGFTLMPESKDLDNGVYISDGSIATYIEKIGNYYRYDGIKFVLIDSHDDFIGDIYWSAGFNYKLFTVNGIVNTNYQYYKDNADKLTDKEKSMRDYLLNNIWGYNDIIVFCNEETYQITRTIIPEFGETLITNGEKNIEFNSLETIQSYSSGDLIYQNGKVHNKFFETTIGDDEILVSLDIYNAIYGTSYNSSQFNFANPSISPTFGEEISLSVGINGNENNIFELKKLVIAGLFLSSNNRTCILVSDKNKIFINKHIQSKADMILGILKNPNELLSLLNTPSNIIISSAFSNELLTYDRTQKINGVSWMIAGIVCILIACFLIYLFVNTNILRQKKSIGILRSLGSKNSDIIKIYLIQGILVAFVITILSLSLSIVLMQNGNNILDSDVAKGAFLVDFHPQILYYVAAAPFLAVALSLLLPIVKLFKMKPIDAIRKVA